MLKLNYETLEKQGFEEYLLKDAPERVLQFGEGNFLRAFVDYFVDVMNEKADFNSKVVLCQPISTGLSEMINEQEGLYTLFLRGFENGEKINKKRVISCVSRCINPYEDFQSLLECAKNPDLRYIACNTTEAGIAYDENCKFTDKPASSYPGKLTQFMYERYLEFGEETGKGFVILSCELIDDNGQELRKCVLKYANLWGLGDKFITWIEKENIFCSTLVDRIVTGYPRNEAAEICEELQYEDRLIDTGEIFGFWVIEGPESLKKELPFEEAGLPVIITNDHKPYKQRKVRILNGAHTSFVLGAYKSGQNIVRDCMNDEVIQSFMNTVIYEEIIPTLDLPKDELETFASTVTERFKNPFIDHNLLDISLNSTSKWRARVMPSLKEYVARYGELPRYIVASFAFYLDFYRGVELKTEGLLGLREKDVYMIKDDRNILEFYYDHREDRMEDLVKSVCSNLDFWGENLLEIEGFQEMVVTYMEEIQSQGVYQVMKSISQSI